VLATSKISRNVAEGGDYTFNSAGGAIYFDGGAGEIVDCELLENIARGGQYANAGTVLETSHCVPSPLHCTNGLRRRRHQASCMQVRWVSSSRD
jgi:hypothetical protein